MKGRLLDVLLLVVLVLGLALGYETWQRRRERQRTAQAALTADTTRAHQDTSRLVVLAQRDSLRILGDSLRLVQRLVVQRQQSQDQLDRALNQQRIALAALTVQVQGLAARVRSDATTDSAGIRLAHFQVRQAPYTVTADVRVPEPPQPGEMAVAVTLDPATIGLRLSCSRPNAEGIRSATATASGPPWLPLTVGRVEQDPSLCASPALTKAAPSWWRRLAPHLSAGYGVTRAPDGTVQAGPQLGVHIDLWRPFQ